VTITDPNASPLSLLESLNSDHRVAICGHTRPDGDAVGSTIALSLALSARGVQVDAVTPDDADPPQSYSWLEGFDRLRPATTLAPNQKYDVFIAVDCPHPARLGLARSVMEQAKTTLLIDHHPDNLGYADSYLVDRSAASTTALIWSALGQLGWERPEAIATACLAGLVTDTGGFRYSNTTPQALQLAAEMLQVSGGMGVITANLFESKSRALLSLEALVSDRVTLHNEGSVVVSWLSTDDFTTLGASPHEGENLVDVVRTVGGPEVVVLITLGVDGPRVSLRSKSEFDVAAVAGRYGGGGHRAAAGVTWPDSAATVDDVLESLLPLLPCGPSTGG